MIKMVKPIAGLFEDKNDWNLQKFKTGKLQHQMDSHRAYMFDHELTKFHPKKERVDIEIGRLPNVNYFKFLKGTKDATNLYEDKCDCNDFEKISKCNICSKLRDGIASRTVGKKYEQNNIPKWNLTFTAGALRSQNRVFYGTYRVRARTNLHSNCCSFITFSMLLPVSDPKFSNTGIWEEIALGFSSSKKHRVSLFIKSTLSNTRRKEILLPIDLPDRWYCNKHYNNYTLEWRENSITLYVNSNKVYTSLPNHPKPQLPGYSYFIVRPNYNTESYSLIKQIKEDNNPNINIKSFSYTPL